jgi:hypothetical protein
MDLKSKLSEIVGPDYVDDSPESLSTYSKDHSLFSVSGLPDIIVRPDMAEQVQKIVHLANETKVPVIPVSSSVHFNGSTLPKMGGIIMDMRRMNRILNVDLPNRLARIEAGVTWGQIQGELEKINQRMIMPLFPLASSSVVSSLLGRDVPTNPRYEYAEPMTSSEVIWGNGMRFRTGSASTPGFPDKSIAKGGNPQGPGVDWYRFLQGAEGTMGIVTWAIVKFEYLPEFNNTYFMAFDDLVQTIELLYRIQRRMIGNECFLVNRQVGALILGEKESDYNRLKHELPPWFMVLVLSGPPRLPEEKVAYEKEALDEIVSQIPNGTRILKSLPGVVGLEKRLPPMLRKPWSEERVYWKHQLKGGCQDLMLISKMEMAPKFTRLVTDVASSHGYDAADLGVYLQPIEQGRACHLEYQFYYNPADERGKEKVKTLFVDAAQRLFREGAFFSRPYGLLSPMVFEHARGYTNTIRKVKGVLDPSYVMCPGNLCF